MKLCDIGELSPANLTRAIKSGNLTGAQAMTYDAFCIGDCQLADGERGWRFLTEAVDAVNAIFDAASKPKPRLIFSVCPQRYLPNQRWSIVGIPKNAESARWRPSLPSMDWFMGYMAARQFRPVVIDSMAVSEGMPYVIAIEPGTFKFQAYEMAWESSVWLSRICNHALETIREFRGRNYSQPVGVMLARIKDQRYWHDDYRLPTQDMSADPAKPGYKHLLDLCAAGYSPTVDWQRGSGWHFAYPITSTRQHLDGLCSIPGKLRRIFWQFAVTERPLILFEVHRWWQGRYWESLLKFSSGPAGAQDALTENLLRAARACDLMYFPAAADNDPAWVNDLREDCKLAARNFVEG